MLISTLRLLNFIPIIHCIYNICLCPFSFYNVFVSSLLNAPQIVLGSPVFIYGALNNIIPYLLPSTLTRKVEDRQFVSSIVFGMGIVSFPIIYLIQFAIFWIISGTWWLALIYFVSLPVTGLLSFAYSRFFVKLSSKIRFNFNKNKPEYYKLINLRKEIINKMDEITSNGEIVKQV